MSKLRGYLDRQQPLAVTEYGETAEKNSSMFVTIPCFDEPDLVSSLQSLANCTPPAAIVTVIVVVNSSDTTPQEILARNRQTIEDVLTWREKHPDNFFRLRLLHAPSLPSKWAGVGWARKIAMDEAVCLLDQSGKEEGILVAFDADSSVTSNYLTSIETAFRKNPKYNFVNLNFSHPVDDPSLSISLREGIILYEIYLRYLRNAMKWCGYPHAIHTIGSSFAVKASAYVKQGGMNRRLAGEDFHFLHKIVQLGDYGLISDATVFPAARISHRVPFGTGAALKKWEEGNPELHSVYSLDTFDTLNPLLRDPAFFFLANNESWKERTDQFNANLQSYLSATGTLDRLAELKKNCSDVRNFTNRFFHIVSAFWIIQYLNLNESNEGGKGLLLEEASKLLVLLNRIPFLEKNARELLESYRQIDLTDSHSTKMPKAGSPTLGI